MLCNDVPRQNEGFCVLLYIFDQDQTVQDVITLSDTLWALSPARWDDKHTYLSSLGMLGTTQLNSIFFCRSHNI